MGKAFIVKNCENLFEGPPNEKTLDESFFR
jgi:hypothetical protein